MVVVVVGGGENAAVLALFGKIPKATVGDLMASISERLREDRQGQNLGVSAIGATGKVPPCPICASLCFWSHSLRACAQKKTTNLKKLIFLYVFSMCVILAFIGCFVWLLLDYSRSIPLPPPSPPPFF